MWPWAMLATVKHGEVGSKTLGCPRQPLNSHDMLVFRGVHLSIKNFYKLTLICLWHTGSGGKFRYAVYNPLKNDHEISKITPGKGNSFGNSDFQFKQMLLFWGSTWYTLFVWRGNTRSTAQGGGGSFKIGNL